MLKELKQQLEQAKSHGEKELPQGLREDERFRLLLRMLEKQVGAANRRGGGAAFRLGAPPAAARGKATKSFNGSRTIRRPAAGCPRGPSFPSAKEPRNPFAQ